ncbi:neuronal acetylcholine receptor subunit alpha-9-II [Elysia marginata]|uniref:Neuronal acetylcholine receptor subunit alpha-9-II n=1 Tax=Elysia marginata TaxID=1093978 RepID=A0AAV4I4L8_9GAST|nr:neuronal acetylcholine receptor subunit alpha-9-II [Elysia marginata]
MAMLLVSLSTLLTVLVLNVHHKGNLNKPVPLWVRRLVLNFLGKLVRVQEFQNKDQSYCNGNGTNGGPRSNHGGNPFNRHNHQKKNNLEGQSVGERPLGNEFFIMRSSAANNTSLQNSNGEPARDGGVEAGLDTSFTLPTGTGFATTEQSNLSLSLLREQLHVLEREEARIDGKVKHDHLSTEWKRVACVLDRVFLLLFLFILVASSLGILLPLSTS